MYSEIKEQFKEVIKFSQNIPNPQVDILFSQWYENKKDIIHAFGDKLIVEIPNVHFHLDEKAKKRAYSEFIDNINLIFHNDELVQFLAAQDANSFFNNTIYKPYEKENIKIPIGMKLVKAFKFFEKDPKLLDTFQQQASRVIQEDKIEGTLCFSVHPLDFLSTSNNTYNWRSCHALDGEFRAGNLSYMVDNSTIICYLKGADDVILPMFPSSVPWNSKKWRMLAYISEEWDMLFMSKQYPYSIPEDNFIMVVDMLGKALNINTKLDFTKPMDDYILKMELKDGSNYYFNDKYLPIWGSLVPLEKIVSNGLYSLQFNDLLSSSTYKKPYYSIKHYYGWEPKTEFPKVTIGRKVDCLCCNENRIEDSNFMVCNCCIDDLGLSEEECYYCDCCGRTLYEGDDFSIVGDQIVCESCFDSQCFVCDRCGEPGFKENMHYDRKYEEYICTECYNRLRGDTGE